MTSYAQTTQLADDFGSSLIGFIGSDTGGTRSTVQTKLRDIASAKDFGAVADGATNNNTALTAALAWAAARSFSGNSPRLVFPAGRYVFSADLNWALNRLHLQADGEVWLINTGTASGFKLDGGAAGPGVYGMKITGQFQIYGAAGGTYGIFARALYNCDLELNCRAAAPTYAGFFGQWLVNNRIVYTMSSNEGGLSVVPAKGMHLTTRNTSEECAYNDIKAIVAGMATGIYLDGSLGNSFYGGSAQGCSATGLETTANAWENKLRGVDFEANALDVKDASRRLLLDTCDMTTGVQFTATADGGRIRDGRCQNITTIAGAKNILLDCGYSLPAIGVGTVTDGATNTVFGSGFYNINTNVTGRPKTATVLTVTTGAFAYTNVSGMPQIITVSGGTVSTIVFSHSGGYVTGTIAGQFTLPPGDTITVNNTAIPQIVVFW